MINHSKMEFPLLPAVLKRNEILNMVKLFIKKLEYKFTFKFQLFSLKLLQNIAPLSFMKFLSLLQLNH